MLTGPLTETPEQGALRDTVRGILSSHLPPDRALELDAGQGFDPAVWRAFADAGLLGLGADPDRGMRAMGAMGLAAESAMQMYFRDARLALFSPVSNEMARNMIGEALGLPRSC